LRRSSRAAVVWQYLALARGVCHKIRKMDEVRNRTMRVLAVAALAASLLLVAGRGAVAQQEFGAWLSDLRAEALGRGIKPATLDAALAGLSPIPRVIELDRRPPEFTLTFTQYLERVVPDRRVQVGRRKLEEHATLLDEISRKYHVQPRFIVALWGVETDFGRITGGFPVVASLATLAHDGRRSAFFRKELMLALEILDQGHIAPGDMKGSWAGAMGQNQFMPSSFHAFAVDHDGDGHKDIWGTLPDVFASIANYLSRSGWRDDITWGRPVRLPKDFPAALTGRKITKALAEWQALGVRRDDGGDLPGRNLQASVITPQKNSLAPAYVGYHNYNVILRWNRSDYFAVAVGTLADRLRP